MVLTHDLWVTRFGADSGIVGRELRLDGEPVRVIGVLQPAPFFPDRVDAIANMGGEPASPERADDRGGGRTA
jgi:hypothetical protein